MQKISLPYYKESLILEMDEKNLQSVLVSRLHEFRTDMAETEIVKKALCNPIGTHRLSDLVKEKHKILLITSDHTRAVPSKITLPLILEEIRAGNKEAEVTILIATGLHRATTEKEQREMFGDEIVNREKIIVHDAFKKEDMVSVCALPSGASFEVNKLVLEADFIVCEGFIEPHFFAGFSGGRKSILPGVCSEVTVNENHCAKALSHANSKGGILKGNIIHEDMIFAAKKVAVGFILNVALGEKKNIIAAFAGDLDRAHSAGCDFILELSCTKAVTGDIVVTSNGGYPLDQNLYQSPKAITTAAECAGEDGVIVMASSCFDGFGGSYFENLMISGTPKQIYEKICSIPPKETIPEQWSAQALAGILMKHPIILVTTFLDHDQVRKANMIPASTIEEAMEKAYAIKGKNARVVVIPDGVSVIALKS